VSQGTKSLIRYAVIIAALVAAIWFGLKWFGGVAKDNAGDYDGGKGRAEDIVEDQING